MISAHELLVAAVDPEDAQAEPLGDNDVRASMLWTLEQVSPAQLLFPDGVPTADDDWLSASHPDGQSLTLILKDADGQIVDEVEYASPLEATDIESLEKGDPSVAVDADEDGIDDGWYISRALYTPGTENNNDGLKETVDDELVTHQPSADADPTVLNRSLNGIGELAGLPSGQEWTPFSTSDLAKIVDRLTVEGLRLETAGHLLSGSEAWIETADGYAVSGDTHTVGAWEWSDIPDGTYRVNLYGKTAEQLAVRWLAADGTGTDWQNVPTLIADAQGRFAVGQIAIGDETPTNTLLLEARCQSTDGVCHFAHARLDPQLVRVGPINVNTAPVEVLAALPGMTDALASRIIAGRPYGDQDQKGRGIGDLLLGDILGTTEEDVLDVFRSLAHLLTTQSNVFSIVSIAEAQQSGRLAASQRIQTIIQRLTASDDEE